MASKNKLESIQYGFNSDDEFVLKNQEYSDAAGTYLASVEATHQGKIYLIQLIQPETQGSGGIWAINNISPK